MFKVICNRKVIVTARRPYKLNKLVTNFRGTTTRNKCHFILHFSNC